MTPRRPSSSFGLIAVSTLAMVFAVSSSLLLFSAHRHASCGMHRQQLLLHNQSVRARPAKRFAVPPDQPIGGIPPAPECKGPVYRPTSDGRTEVVFEQCPARPFAAQ